MFVNCFYKRQNCFIFLKSIFHLSRNVFLYIDCKLLIKCNFHFKTSTMQRISNSKKHVRQTELSVQNKEICEVEYNYLLSQDFRIPKIIKNVFPWSSDLSFTFEKNNWPYILQDAYRPCRKKGLLRDFNSVDKSVQTDSALWSNYVNNVIRYSNMSEEIDLKGRHRVSELLSLEKIKIFDTSENYSITSDKYFKQKNEIKIPINLFNLDINRKSENISEYISDISYDLNYSKPSWLEQAIPNYIHEMSIIQASRPWHDISHCTWQEDLQHMSYDPISFTLNIFSPILKWGKSICSIKHKEFECQNRMYKIKHKSVKKSTEKMKQAPQKISKLQDKSEELSKSTLDRTMCDMSFKQTIPVVKVENKISVKSSNYSEVSDKNNTIVDENRKRRIEKRHLEMKNVQKSLIANFPKIDELMHVWNLILKPYEWSEVITKTHSFPDKPKIKKNIKKPESRKYKRSGQWPYVETITKQTTSSSTLTELSCNEQVCSTISIEDDLDVQLFTNVMNDKDLKTMSGKQNSKAMKCSSINNIIKEHRMSISGLGQHSDDHKERRASKKSIHERSSSYGLNRHVVNLSTAHLKTSLVKEETHADIVCPIQNKFSSKLIAQTTNIETSTKPVHEYKMSNFDNFLKKITYYPIAKEFSKITTYYAEPFNSSNDIFCSCENESIRYKNGNLFLITTDIHSGVIFYPNGYPAVQITQVTVENRTVKRCLIYGNKKKMYPLLGIFDSLGNGIVYNHFGKIRMNYSQNFGTLFETPNGYVLKWRWHNIRQRNEKVTHLVNAFDDIKLSKNECEEMNHQGINLIKKLLDERSQPPYSSYQSLSDININEQSTEEIRFEPKRGYYTHIRPFRLVLNEYLIFKVVNQKHITLHFKAEDRHIKIDLGVILHPEDVLRTEELDGRLILKQNIPCHFEHFPGNTDSLVWLLKACGDVNKINYLIDDLSSRGSLAPSPSQLEETIDKEKIFRMKVLHSKRFGEGQYLLYKSDLVSKTDEKEFAHNREKFISKTINTTQTICDLTEFQKGNESNKNNNEDRKATDTLLLTSTNNDRNVPGKEKIEIKSYLKNYKRTGKSLGSDCITKNNPKRYKKCSNEIRRLEKPHKKHSEFVENITSFDKYTIL